jgi:hypothetical protein
LLEDFERKETWRKYVEDEFPKKYNHMSTRIEFETPYLDEVDKNYPQHKKFGEMMDEYIEKHNQGLESSFSPDIKMLSDIRNGRKWGHKKDEKYPDGGSLTPFLGELFRQNNSILMEGNLQAKAMQALIRKANHTYVAFREHLNSFYKFVHYTRTARPRLLFRELFGNENLPNNMLKEGASKLQGNKNEPEESKEGLDDE